MSVDRYRTIAAASEGTYRELASRFIARAFPIADEAQFKAEADRLSSEHPASRHACYAWVIGDAGEHHRANDDGEPSGTAGKPILRRIQAAGLTYCGVAVVRYFGGTLLGKPGLIHAYGEAARLAIATATIIEHVVMERSVIVCGYDRFDVVKSDVLLHGGRIITSAFTDLCTAELELPIGRIDVLRPKWTLLGVSLSAG